MEKYIPERTSLKHLNSIALHMTNLAVLRHVPARVGDHRCHAPSMQTSNLPASQILHCGLPGTVELYDIHQLLYSYFSTSCVQSVGQPGDGTSQVTVGNGPTVTP
eukprot:6490454-Amphidinium_carterae.2